MSMQRFTFGTFELDPTRLELWRDGIRLKVGARACRVLLALLERPGEVVSQKELLTVAWPGLHVADVNLRVHMAALRKALAAGANEAFDISTIPRVGYVFIGPVSIPSTIQPLRPRVPRQLNTLFGRDEALARLDESIATHRIVTIVGTGGIGKTAMALAAISEPAGNAATECVFVDFSTSVSSLHVAACIFEALELEGTPGDVVAHIERGLRGRSILLVFDNCEHVIGPVASLVARLTSGNEGVSILATSREPLRVPGERVFPLEPLNCPSAGAALTAQTAMDYSAVQMFAEAASRRSGAFAIDDANASLLGDVCRRLDGNPLAIELASATSDSMTIAELARRLDDRFTVLTRGTRTALPRHRTLQAALDWSYETLNKEESSVMRRLGVFPGRFSADDAHVVASIETMSHAAVHEAVANLAAKSLITVDFSGETASFRYLETTRVYARLKLLESGEAPAAYGRFVDYTLHRLATIDERDFSTTDLKQAHSAIVDDWRAAHDWSARNGDWKMALELMAAAIGLCQSLNIKVEYAKRATETLRILTDGPQEEDAARLEMIVCGHTAQMLIDTQPSDPSNFIERIEATALRALELATRLNAPDEHMNALGTLMIAALTAAHVDKVTACGLDIFEFARRSEDPDFLRTAHYLSGYAKYYSSDFDAALQESDQALALAAPATKGTPVAFDHVPSVRILRARTLWIRGEFNASLEEMEGAYHSAIKGAHVPTIAWMAWGGGASVYSWAGDHERAVANARLFEELATEYSNLGWARYIPSLRDAMERLGDGSRSFGAGPTDWAPHVNSHADVMTSIHCAFHRAVDLQRIEATPQHWCAAEHFRAAGEHHLAAGRIAGAEKLFLHALATSQAHTAVAWEIRATVSLAHLRIRQEQTSVARSLLEQLICRHLNSSANADIGYATALLARS